MTNAEYIELSRRARRSYARITRETMTKLLDVYIDAGKLAAAEVRRATLSGLSDLTSQSWKSIELQLEEGARQIRAAIESRVYESIDRSLNIGNKIQTNYFDDAIERSDLNDFIPGISTKVKEIYRGINDRIVRSVVNRVYQDGYGFSTRIWRAGLSYQEQIKNVISTGFSIGRDTVKIAKDLQVYIADGKLALANRYGPNLVIIRDGKKRISWKLFKEKYGAEATNKARAFMRRVGNKVDWRALRIVRSELYASLQEAAVFQGKANPGANGLYDWVLEAGRQHWNCDCPDNQRNGPYIYTEVPGFPHSNCRCSVRPQLRNTNEFIKDLKAWGNGERIDYLDRWYSEYSPIINT